MGDLIKSYRFVQENFPIKNLGIVTLVWIFLALLNFVAIKYYGYWVGTDWFFPFSVLKPSYFLLSGFVFSFLFIVLGFFSFYQRYKISMLGIIFLCVILIIVGNLIQGNFDNAFLKPFYQGGQQYYSDAINVKDIGRFLEEFHQKQETYLLHTKTHPPFVVILHCFLLMISGGSIWFLSLCIFLMSMLIFPIMKMVFSNLGFNENKIKDILLLFAIVPSVNIYTLVSIDGLVLVTVSLSLLAVSRVYRFGIDFCAILWGTLSILFSNMLSFSGLFVIAFMGILALMQLKKKEYSYTLLGGLSLGISILVFVGYYYIFGYNHWEVFRTASASENPQGFMLISNPKFYVGTRLQDIGEILMFLSLPFISLWFSVKYRIFFLKHHFSIKVFFSAIFVLLLMFSTGAYGTGETARACLFIVPFVFILNGNIPKRTFIIVYFLCLFQTFIMQTIGNFFW